LPAAGYFDGEQRRAAPYPGTAAGFSLRTLIAAAMRGIEVVRSFLGSRKSLPYNIRDSKIPEKNYIYSKNVVAPYGRA
jgi:hypothetical protein